MKKQLALGLLGVLLCSSLATVAQADWGDRWQDRGGHGWNRPAPGWGWHHDDWRRDQWRRNHRHYW